MKYRAETETVCPSGRNWPVAQHSGGVADRSPGLDLGERHDLGHVVSAVLLSRVANHLVPVPGVEVHVDVWHGYAAGV